MGDLAKRMGVVVSAALVVQVALGIITLIHVAPLSLSLMHQAGGIILFLTSGALAWTAARGAVLVEPELAKNEA